MSDIEKQIAELKPFIQYSQQFQKNLPVIAFYLKTYACEKTHGLYKQLKAQGQDVTVLQESLKQWFSDCDQLKAQNAQLLSNKQSCQQQMTEYTLKLFLKCDNEDRDDTFTLNTVKNFKIVAALFESLNVFGPISQDFEKKRKYAKVQAIKVYKKLKDPTYVRKQNQNIEDEIAKLDQQLAQNQQLNDDENVGDEGVNSNTKQAYVSNFNNNKNNFQQNQQQNQFNNYNNQNQQPQNQQFNNYNQPPQQQQPFQPQQPGFKSVFDKVPAVINQSTIKDQHSVAKILDNQNQLINNNNNGQKTQTYQDLKSRFQSKKGTPIGVLRSQVKKNCEHALNEIDFKNYEKTILLLQETLVKLDELIEQ